MSFYQDKCDMSRVLAQVNIAVGLSTKKILHSTCNSTLLFILLLVSYFVGSLVKVHSEIRMIDIAFDILQHKAYLCRLRFLTEPVNTRVTVQKKTAKVSVLVSRPPIGECRNPSHERARVRSTHAPR